MFVGARSLQRKGKKEKRLEKRKTPAEEHRKGDDVLVVQGSLSRLLAQTRLTSRKIASFEVEQSLVLSLELAKVRFEVPRRLAPVSSSKHNSWCFCQQDEISNRTKYPQSTSRSCPFSFPFLVFQKFVHRTCYAWYNVSSTCTTNPQTVRFLSKYNFLTNCISQLVMSLQSLPLL